jgi:hypothetical protein
MSKEKETIQTESHAPLSGVVESSFQLVDEGKEFRFKKLCPYCKADLTYEAEGWVQDDNGQWMADSLDVKCHSEPDMEDGEAWEEWLRVHSEMPYVHQLPVDTQVLNWINERYRFKLD